MTSFAAKQLRFKFVLSNGITFDQSNSNELTVTGLRATVRIKGSGFPAFPEADLRINGLRQQDMNALTALSFQTLGVERNTVIIEANGGDGNGWSSVFAGQIITAGPDYTSAPDVAFHAFARVLGFESINPATPTGYTGATDVAVIVQTIATKMGFGKIENTGVVGITLDSPYFANTLAEQLRTVVQQAGIDCYIDGNVIAITLKGQPRVTPTWVLTPSSGLVGYPTLDSRGFIGARSLFNPAFRFGGRVRIAGSDLPRANGDWLIGTLSLLLESVKPGGAWFSDLLCYPPGSLPPIR